MAQHPKVCGFMEEQLLGLLAVRPGHFILESGHHGNLWLDLDSLFLRPVRWMPFARELARRLSAQRVEAVVGPLVGGAFVAQVVAAELDLQFAFAERHADANGATYRIPDALHESLHGRSVAIVDDAIHQRRFGDTCDLCRPEGPGRGAGRSRRAAHSGEHRVAFPRSERSRCRKHRAPCQRAVGARRVPAVRGGRLCQ
jgi:hypothetical protein